MSLPLIVHASCTTEGCELHHGDRMVLVAINLVENSEAFRTIVTQCTACLAHRFIGIPSGVEITVGKLL